MPESLKKLRIFVASPGDVADERTRLKSVVEDLNNGLANHLSIVIELKEWSQVVPNMGRGQQVIFDQIPVKTWDLIIGILWLRYGTPSGGANPSESGTLEEFNVAYEMWKQAGKPRIMFYRCTRPPEDITKLNIDDFAKIKQFFEGFETGGKHEGLYRSYDTAENFERSVRNHITDFLVEYTEQVEHKTITPETLQVYTPVIPNNLPRRQAFFGRTTEMDKVMRAINPADRTWGVLVDGIGGIGKSAIAIEATHLSQEKNLFDAFVFVTAKTKVLEPGGIKELNPPARTLNEFLNETSRVLGQSGIAKLAGDEKRRVLIDVLRSIRTLLIYDNLETLSKEEQEGIADFLRELPQGCKAIITSRWRGGEGGVWLRVEKLDWDAALDIIKNQMSLDEGLSKKMNHVGQARWQELFDEIKGSPLALVHTMGLMRVRATLTFDGALELLRGNRDDDLQKFIFQEARKELTENDKAALGALSFFVPSATFEAWMEVANLSRNVLESTVDRLGALSLVDVLIGEERYAVHPLTRTFVRDELLADKNIAYETCMRFTQNWVNYTDKYGGSSRNYKHFNLLEREWMNLEAAANWLWGTANVENNSIGEESAARLFVRFTRSVERFLRFSNRWDDHQNWNEQAYEIARLLADWSRAGWCARAVAWTLLYRGNIEQAEMWAKRCEEMWLKGGSIGEKAIAIKLFGTLAKQRKDYAKAEQLFLEALQMRNDKGVAIMQTDLGELAHERGDYETAEQYYLQGLEWAKKNKDRPRQASRTANLGQLAVDRGRWAEARALFDEALKLAYDVGRQDDIARIKYGLALVYKNEGNMELALLQAQEALKIYKQLQHRDLIKVQELVEKLKKSQGQ